MNDNYDISNMLSLKQLDLKFANKQQENRERFWRNVTSILCIFVWALSIIIVTLIALLIYHFYKDKDFLMNTISILLSSIGSFIMGYFLKRE